MRHWFVKSANGAVPTWREALPAAVVVDGGEIDGIPGNEPGIVWWRLSAGAEIEMAMAEMRRHCALPVVLLSDAPNDEEALRAFSAGAAGYCNTHAAPEVLRQIAVVVENGGLWLGASLLQRLVGSTSRLHAGRNAGVQERWSDKLSEREREVAEAVASGASNKEIADRLGIAERTVKAHLGAIFEKLGVRDRLQLSLRVNGV